MDDTPPSNRRITDAGVLSSFFFTRRCIHIFLHQSSVSSEVNPTAHIASGTIRPCVCLMSLTAFSTRRSPGFSAVPSASMLAIELRPYIQDFIFFLRIEERLPKVTQLFDVFEKHTWSHWLSSRVCKVWTPWKNIWFHTSKWLAAHSLQAYVVGG